MGTDRGFLEHERRDPTYRPVAERVRDFRDVAVHLSREEIVLQASRCMDCGVPFCHGWGCPVTNMIPEFNEHVCRGRWAEALKVLLATNPFPEFTGRVCPAPCESACVLDINDDPVTIREIELAVIEYGFEHGLLPQEGPAQRRQERVAVVGSGPAGLAAADCLNAAGFRVCVFENARRPGGILRYGIPDFKLEKSVLDRRLALMERQGVRFETGVDVGEDVSPRYLRDRFDGIVLTGGAREPRELDVPGRELAGIHQAMHYLVQQNRLNGGEPLAAGEQRIAAAGKRVVVIGGGDTGSDCVGTALRQGAAHVLQLEILPEPPPERAPQTPWPQWPLRRRDSSSHKEGCERRWSVATTSFAGEDGAVARLQGVEVDWKPAPPGGRAGPRPREGTEFAAAAQLVVLAMGFVGPGPNRLVDKLEIARDERGFIRRDDRNMTSVPGIFVAGDMTQGASLVVRAIEDGKRAAKHLRGYLDGRS